MIVTSFNKAGPGEINIIPLVLERFGITADEVDVMADIADGEDDNADDVVLGGTQDVEGFDAGADGAEADDLADECASLLGDSRPEGPRSLPWPWPDGWGSLPLRTADGIEGTGAGAGTDVAADAAASVNVESISSWTNREWSALSRSASSSSLSDNVGSIYLQAHQNNL